MRKLVPESLEHFMFEANELGDKKTGPIRNALRYIRTAPGRSIRKKRARFIMNNYKKKLISDIDKIFEKNSTLMEKTIDRIENRVLAIDSKVKYLDPKLGSVKTKPNVSTIKSKLSLIKKTSKDVKGLRYEEVLSEIRNSLENIIKKAKDMCDKALDNYGKSVVDRLERSGTLINVEFYPEEKTALLNEWRNIENDVNIYVENKLIELLDDVKVSELEDIKAQLKIFIDDQSSHRSPTLSLLSNAIKGQNLHAATSSYTVIKSSGKKGAVDNNAILNVFIREVAKKKMSSVSPDTAFKLKPAERIVDFLDDNGTNYNRAGSSSVKFVVNDNDEALALQFFDITRTKEVPTSPPVTIPIQVKTHPRCSIGLKTLSGKDIIEMLFNKYLEF